GEMVRFVRVRPERMRVYTHDDRQTAVVAVEPGLDPVRRREDRREHPEVVRRVGAPASGEHVVGVLRAYAGLDARGERRAIRRAELEQAAHGRIPLTGDPGRAVVAGPDPVAVRRALVGGREVVV